MSEARSRKGIANPVSCITLCRKVLAHARVAILTNLSSSEVWNKSSVLNIDSKKECCVFTGISLRAETPLQFPGSFSLQEEIPPSPGHPSGETLHESMTRLERGLTSGTLLMQFEVRMYNYAHVWIHVFAVGLSVCLSVKHVWKLVDDPCVCVFWYRSYTGRKQNC